MLPPYNHIICCWWHRRQFISVKLSRVESLCLRTRVGSDESYFHRLPSAVFQDKVMLDDRQMYKYYSDRDFWMAVSFTKWCWRPVVFMWSRCHTKWGESAFNLNNDDDILWKANAANCSFLILLGLRAAFDTVDHPIWIWKPWALGGITCPSLHWFIASSYTETFLSPVETITFFLGEHHIWSSSRLNFRASSFSCLLCHKL